MKRAFIFGYSEKSEFTKSQAIALKYAGYSVNESNIYNSNLYLFNWYENIYNYNILSFIKKLGFLIYLKIFNKKLVFYVHNINPHKKDNTSPTLLLSSILFCLLFILSNKVIILSLNTKKYFKYRKILFKLFNYKIIYIPHPNMISNRTNDYINDKMLENQHELSMLYFGPILKYKNIDLLIKVINRLSDYPIKILITGTCQKEYQKELEKMIKNRNIRIFNKYYTDDELFNLFQKYDICVFPLDLKSSLNSSSVILSFSMGKTVICPKISTLLDYPNDLYFSYDYCSIVEHEKNLEQMILKVFEIKISNSTKLKIMGEKCYNYVRNNNSQDIINKLYCINFG